MGMGDRTVPYDLLGHRFTQSRVKLMSEKRRLEHVYFYGQSQQFLDTKREQAQQAALTKIRQ